MISLEANEAQKILPNRYFILLRPGFLLAFVGDGTNLLGAKAASSRPPGNIRDEQIGITVIMPKTIPSKEVIPKL